MGTSRLFVLLCNILGRMGQRGASFRFGSDLSLDNADQTTLVGDAIEMLWS